MQKVREAAARMSARTTSSRSPWPVHNYEVRTGGYPPSNTTSPPWHGWPALILPDLEQETVRNIYVMTANWYDPANEVARKAQVKTFLCPSAPNSGRTGSDAVAGDAGSPFAAQLGLHQHLRGGPGAARLPQPPQCQRHSGYLSFCAVR